jgi:hypothetical protein
MGGFIPFPNVPEAPGVPQLTRAANAAIASSPVLAIGLGSVENLLISALQQPPTWGIFDQSGNQLGIPTNSQSALQAIGGALLSQLTGSTAPSLSTFSVEYTQETRVSTFPVETGGFASYNKVQNPASPIVTLILDGQESDRTYFINSIQAACIGTDLYNVVTPEVTYYNYNIERFSYSRKATKGATLLYVEIYLKEIRQVEATLTTAQIVAPVDPAATPAVDNGVVQAAPVNQSVLNSLNNGISSHLSSFFGAN